jgi:hypothetical protein
VAADVAGHGLTVGEMLGAGGYAVAFAADCVQNGPCVLKVPCLPLYEEPGLPRTIGGGPPYRVWEVTPTGPFSLDGPRSLQEAARLLQDACEQQRVTRCGRPLARLLDVFTLGGQPAALYERAPGRSLRALMAADPDAARAAIPAIAIDLFLLHESFGRHKDLKPDHIFVNGTEVVFIDPLPRQGDWLGTLGYLLPAGPWRVPEEPLEDLAALAAIIAEVWGAQVGWNERFVRELLNSINGRFGTPVNPLRILEILEKMREDFRPVVPPSLREWVLEVTRTVLRTWVLSGPMLPESGWSRAQLETLAKDYPRFRRDWRTETVVNLARQVLETQAVATLPILADALEDAGCDNAELLACCRTEGEFTEREWAVRLAAGPRV